MKKKLLITGASIVAVGTCIAIPAFMMTNNNNTPPQNTETEFVVETEFVTETETSSVIEPITWHLGDDVTAVLNTDGELIISGDGKASLVFQNGATRFEGVPWIIDKQVQMAIKKVTIKDTVKIDDMDSWFTGCENLTDISEMNIPDGVSSMKSTFFGCSKLTDISNLNIPDSVIYMDAMLALTGITSIPDNFLPANVEQISYLFYGTPIKDISNLKFPESLTVIDCAFLNCSKLENIDGLTIPSNVVFAEKLFRNCPLASGTITFKSSPAVHNYMFDNCGEKGSGITVNYTKKCDINSLLDTATSDFVKKGTELK